MGHSQTAVFQAKPQQSCKKLDCFVQILYEQEKRNLFVGVRAPTEQNGTLACECGLVNMRARNQKKLMSMTDKRELAFSE